MPSEIFFHHQPPWNVRMVQDQCRILSAVACQSFSPKPGFRCLRIPALFMAVGSCLPLQKGWFQPVLWARSVAVFWEDLISGLSLAIVPNHMHSVVLHRQYCTWCGGVPFNSPSPFLNFLCAAVDLAWESCGDCTVCRGSWVWGIVTSWLQELVLSTGQDRWEISLWGKNAVG